MNLLNKSPLPLRLCAGFIVFAAIQHEVAAKPPATENFLMCSPGKVIFSETFTPGTVSERWGIRAYYKIDNGILKRTGHEPEKTARTFLKDAAFHNVIFRFDFRFEGASEIRLMTGGGGGYNTVTQIFPTHFQVNTAKRNNEFVPSMQGECAFDFKEGKWHTMTVEFHDEEVVAHVDKDHFIVGRHPIINTERTYLAFQVSGTGAAFDNFSVWEAAQKENWQAQRVQLTASQASRPPAIKRDGRQQYDLIMLKLKDRLSRSDAKYQGLVTHHEKLKAALKADYPEAFRTHKELSKGIAKKRIEIKGKDPRFKQMEGAVNKARKKEKEYIHSRHKELENLPKHLYYAAFEERRKAMAYDSRLKALEKITARLEADLHRAFPGAFREVDALVEKRNAYAASLRDDKNFRTHKKSIAEANDAINNYLLDVDPRLKQLAAVRMAIIQGKKQ
ncbi:MAG: hypothetical protein VCA55_05640 [Verrucomicrobiales bacterium]